jgi:Sensors of blue-light using FAD
MYHLIYTSYATRPFSEDELIALLKESRVANKKLGITGMLIYLHNKFIQVLEGEYDKVVELYEAISKDARHKKVTLILEGNTKERIFKDWSMGFKKISHHEFEKLTAFRELDKFFSEKPITNQSPAVLMFLQLFYKKNFNDYPEEIIS